MSFLSRRLVGIEGAFFLQESKHAVSRLVEKNKKHIPANFNSPSSTSGASHNPPSSSVSVNEYISDVLPEVLRNDLPAKVFEPAPDSSISTSPRWILPVDARNVSSDSSDARNPLQAYASLPQVTFGPYRWKLPVIEQQSSAASTANELRHNDYVHANPEKLMAMAEGLSQIAKAFMVATVIVFGGATLVFGTVASRLELHNLDDIRVKGRDIVRPKFETLRAQLTPLKNWVCKNQDSSESML